MNRYNFTITVETNKILSGDDKLKMLADLRARLMGYQTETPDSLKDGNITIRREISLDDIAEAIGVLTSNANLIDPRSIKNCYHYDAAQGRHKCVNVKVKSTKCRGVCEFYKDKRKY